VVDGLAARQRGALGGQLIQALGHPRVRLQERIRADPEAEAADLLLDRILAPQELRRDVRDLRRSLVYAPLDRANLREAAHPLDEVIRVRQLARSRHEQDEGLARVPALADDEM